MALIRYAGDLGGPPTSSVVAIRDLATGVVEEVEATRTPFPEAFLEHPRWSPDGGRLTYTKVLLDTAETPTDSQIFLMTLGSGGPQALTEEGFEAGDAEWSPDGSTILFSREVVHHWFGGGKGAGPNTWIYTMAPDGTSMTQLTFEGMTGAATWTADGAQILFTSIVGEAAIGTPDVYVMNANGSDPKPVALFGDCCRWYPIQQPTP